MYDTNIYSYGVDDIEDDVLLSDGILTTTDNPYNPHTNFEEWYVWDVQNKYNTCALIERIYFERYGPNKNTNADPDPYLLGNVYRSIMNMHPDGLYTVVYE